VSLLFEPHSETEFDAQMQGHAPAVLRPKTMKEILKATTQHGRGTALHVWIETPQSCEGLWATSKRTLGSISSVYRTDLHRGCYHNAYQSQPELQRMSGKINYVYKQICHQLNAPIFELQTQVYMFRLPSVAILWE
jgi:hypothetical protein